ncbi:MAG: tRNA (cytidine(34)-2'-O)-methyltransferase [Deltaproteobacteria bacterium]|nr:tRNA (cytidine(34)-2'-O)-methyltransferase [Deltaproteobacteria bacterium]
MHLVLVAPEIPPNTGNVARLCAATNTPLHLVRPLGFFLDDRRLRRAGLDYWTHVELRIHDSLDALWSVLPIARAYFVSTKGTIPYTQVAFAADDVLVFGSEGAGLPAPLLAAHPDRTITIPMSGPVRSLNLATAAAIVLFEGLRQQSR